MILKSQSAHRATQSRSDAHIWRVSRFLAKNEQSTAQHKKRSYIANKWPLLKFPGVMP